MVRGRIFKRAMGGGCAVALALGLNAPTWAQATISIDGAKPGPRISPFLHGIFFEEINHAGDGGLYAEKLRDRKFEETQRFWKPIGTAQIGFSGSSLEMTAHGVVETEGYWGIGVTRGKTLSFGAKIEGGPVKVELISPTDAVIGSATLKPGVSTAKIKPSATVSNARLRLTAPDMTTRVSDPSLMPLDRYGKAPIRKDLGELVAAIKPSFVRFPGGCFVEGDTLSQSFDWKRSLGDPAERKPNTCIWGYKATNGLGMHEFLQWAEDMKAAPLFVVNCGMSHKDFTPMSEMAPVVQNALDAIEYANGDPKTTKWGAERAKNGHPKSFNLKFIEIGNENGGPLYDERYPLIYNAIKQKYPEIECITDLWGGLPKSAPVNIVDEHYYSDPTFFQRQSNRYDAYKRDGRKVYVGEYAVTEGCGTGNLIAALGEATFITGMERNSDVVAMASYAPLLVNANNRAWNPDAIVFDSSRAFGTPSYWVQRMFSQNRGDIVLPLTISDTRKPMTADNRLKGKVGVGTWSTAAEFADVRVNDQPVDLQGGAGIWTKTAEGTLRQSDRGQNRTAVGGDANASDYTLTLKARKNGGDEGFLILFNAGGPKDYFWWNIGGWGNTRHNIEMKTSGGGQTIADDVPGQIETGRWYDIKIVTSGRNIKCYLDGKLIHDANVPPPPASLAAVSTRDEKTGDVLVKVVNMSSEACNADLRLSNLPGLTGEGAAMTMTSDNPNDENSFATPEKIKPRNSSLSGLSSNFKHAFPPTPSPSSD